MAIDNKEAIKFSNEVVRRFSESLGNLHCDLGCTISLWTDHMSSLIPDDSSEVIEDGRDTLYSPKGDEIHNQIALMEALKAVFDSSTHSDAVSFMKKARVRPLKAGS
jgi:hypothetical protein